MKRSLAVLVFAACAALLPASARAQEAPATVTLHLSDGSVVVGRIVQEDSDRIRIATELFGEVAVSVSDVVDRGAGPTAPAPVQAVAPPPPPPAPPAATAAAVLWSRTASVSASYVSAPFIQGVVDPTIPELTGAAIGLPGRQVSTQTNVSISRVTARDAMQFTGSIGYQNAQPTGTLAHSYTGDFEYRRVLNPRVYFLARTSEKRDEVRNIDNTFLETLGVGWVARLTPRFRLDLVPGVMIHHEQKNTRFDNKWLLSVGGMAGAQAMLNPRSQFEARVIAKQSVQHREIWSVESYVGAQAALTSRLSLTVALTSNYDNLMGQSFTPIPAGALSPGSPELQLFATRKRQAQLSSGLQVRF